MTLETNINNNNNNENNENNFNPFETINWSLEGTYNTWRQVAAQLVSDTFHIIKNMKKKEKMRQVIGRSGLRSGHFVLPSWSTRSDLNVILLAIDVTFSDSVPLLSSPPAFVHILQSSVCAFLAIIKLSTTWILISKRFVPTTKCNYERTGKDDITTTTTTSTTTIVQRKDFSSGLFDCHHSSLLSSIYSLFKIKRCTS